MHYVFQHLYCFLLFGILPSLRHALSSHHLIIFGEPYTLNGSNRHFVIYIFLIPVFPSAYKLRTLNPLPTSWWSDPVNCLKVFLTLVKYLSFPWRMFCQNFSERSYLVTSHMLQRWKFEASALVARFYNAFRRSSQNCRKGAMSFLIFASLFVRLSVSAGVRLRVTTRLLLVRFS
jgi:hypothetical protein